MVREPRLDELTEEDLHRIASLYGAYSIQAEAVLGDEHIFTGERTFPEEDLSSVVEG